MSQGARSPLLCRLTFVQKVTPTLLIFFSWWCNVLLPKKGCYCIVLDLTFSFVKGTMFGVYALMSNYDVDRVYFLVLRYKSIKMIVVCLDQTWHCWPFTQTQNGYFNLEQQNCLNKYCNYGDYTDVKPSYKTINEPINWRKRWYTRAASWENTGTNIRLLTRTILRLCEYDHKNGINWPFRVHCGINNNCGWRRWVGGTERKLAT